MERCMRRGRKIRGLRKAGVMLVGWLRLVEASWCV